MDINARNIATPAAVAPATAVPTPVVGRFAPSPSGRMHLGNVFSCLCAWLSARSQGGSIVLRIEDLDDRCKRPELAAQLIDDLAWLGLEWDEGPYYQHDRLDLYESALRQLQDAGLTYPCFCTRAELHAASAPHASDGTPIIVPINMGDGPYTFRVMQNTSGNNYVELFSVIENVNLSSETAPFLVPNMFVNYNESSAVVAKARELAQGAANQGDVVRNIYQWVVDNITYDHDKAAQLASATGYVPDPDATLASGTGICFDYASLGAAMLRSLGIPCQVITGYVSPDDVYHAWNMVYIDGEWISVEISIKPNSWTRVDLTFAASGAASTIGDGTSYTDRYTY